MTRAPFSRFRLSLIVLLTLIVCPQASPAWASWVVLSGDGGYRSQGLPGEAAAKLAELAKAGAKIKSVTFTRAGGWAILYDKNGQATNRLPLAAAEKLTELADRGVELKSISFMRSGGWVILYDKNGHVEQNVPKEAADKLNELEKSGSEIKSIAFPRRNTWIVLFDQHGSASQGVPETLAQLLEKLASQGVTLKLVGVTPALGWIILFGQNQYASDGLPDSLEKELRAQALQEKSLDAVAFCPDFIHFSQDDEATRKKVLSRMARSNVPGLSMAVIDHGQIVVARGYGVVTPGGETVTQQTRFQAGSVSKSVTAVGALRLVEEGKLALDDDLNHWLTSWKIPANEFTEQRPVTLREALSHTAGFTVHGFPGYAAGDAVPSLVQVLDGKPPANMPPIVVDLRPGTQHRYSGGGYCVIQQAMIDVTGAPFPRIMDDLVLQPLGMASSSFEQPPPSGFEKIAAAGHYQNGQPVAGRYHVYPEMAAAGLWTTPSDLARFVIAIQRAAAGEKNAILRHETLDQMFTPQPESKQDSPYGYALGLFMEPAGRSRMFSHNGRDEGFDAQMMGLVQPDQGVVFMINANDDRGLIDDLLQSVRFEYAWPE